MHPMVTADTRAVFFDAVGTLLFPSPPAPVVYAAAAREHGLDITHEEIRSRFVRAFRAEEELDRAAGWATSEEREQSRWRRIVSDTLSGVADAGPCFRRLYDHFAQPSAWTVPADVGRLFARLMDLGIMLGLASNYDRRLLSVVAGKPELGPLRESVVVSSLVGWRKPAARFFDEVVRVAGIGRGQILFVGDDLENDFEGATAAGLQAVLLDERGRHGTFGRRIRTLGELAE